MNCLWAVLTENVHRVCKSIWFFYACILCFHFCTQVSFYLISNVHFVITFEIPIETFEKCHIEIYRYVSYVKSETSDIWRSGVWLLKPFGARVQENHICDLVKLNSTKKLGPYLKDVTYVTKFFLQNRKIWALRAKFEILLLKNEAFLDGFRLPESFTLATNLF